MAYAAAYNEQVRCFERVLSGRTHAGPPLAATILLVEHDPVITVSRRPTAAGNLVATPEMLAARGVGVEQTDRGGDITYHGPGQLVAYPIVDLNLHNLGLHDYMRLLEDAVIRTCATFGVRATRDPSATGVWITRDGGAPAKVCAMGVRVRRWISMHGLALNVSPDLTHFDLIVPCGLVGRGVTSLRWELGDACPSMAEVKAALVGELTTGLRHAWETACDRRALTSEPRGLPGPAGT